MGLAGGQEAQHTDNLRGYRSRIPAGPIAPRIRRAAADGATQLPRYQSRIGVADEDRGDGAGGEERAEGHGLVLAAAAAVTIRTMPITAP